MINKLLVFIFPLLLLFASNAQAADFTQDGTFTSITQYDGTLVYSQIDSNGLYSLYSKQGPDGPARRLLIPAMKADPKPDLGTLRNGRALLVYSQDGRLYQYDLGSSHSQVIAKVHASGQKEDTPTLWNGTLGFWRHNKSGTGGTYRLFTLYSNRHTRSVKTLRSFQYVQGADLSDSGLAMSVNGFDGSRDLRTATVEVKQSNKTFKTVFVQRSGLGSSVFITNPSWRNNDVYWGYARRGDVPSRALYRAHVTTAKTTVKNIIIPRHFSTPASVQNVAFDNDYLRSPQSPAWFITVRSSEEDYKSTLFDVQFSDIVFP